jgi:hypothetical protein
VICDTIDRFKCLQRTDDPAIDFIGGTQTISRPGLGTVEIHIHRVQRIGRSRLSNARETLETINSVSERSIKGRGIDQVIKWVKMCTECFMD